MTHCPCGSALTYQNCCGRFIDQLQAAGSPEQLMRSRYTAYSLTRMDYIKKTMRGRPLEGFDEDEAARWANRIIWLSLTILSTSMATGDKGYVEFKARYLENDRVHYLQEVSEFHREQDKWFYIDGELKPQEAEKKAISRNSPCPCGSQKKFKNCHGKTPM
ncbi:YchJ family protein [Legionella sp. CNM-4043-24]|uniref:YchJ family protein n=1 Tax=Legionella sp. CNM-4043-24 TaxID=3421646 RepID=UPI00403AFD06